MRIFISCLNLTAINRRFQKWYEFYSFLFITLNKNLNKKNVFETVFIKRLFTSLKVVKC